MTDATRNQLRLFALVVLAFLPAVGLFVFARAQLRDSELQRRQHEIEQFAHVTAVEYQRLLDESRELLGALAEFPEIREARAPACGQRLASVLAHIPQYTTISWVGLDGYMACGSLTVDGDLYLGDRAYFRNTLANRRFSLGDYAIGRITGKPTIGVGYPILTDDGSDIRAVLAASLDLSLLADRARGMRMPEGATLTVIDRQRKVLVRVPARRHPLGYDSVGAAAPDTFPQLPSAYSDPFVLLGTDLDGLDRRFAVVPLRGPGGSAAGHLLVGLEEMTLLADAEEVARREFQYLAITGVSVLILAWLFGHYALIRPTTGVANT